MKYMLTLSVIILLLGTTLVADPIPPSERLSLQLEAVPLVDVLNMIAEQNHLNLVISGEVSGDVTMRLDNVDITTALNAILAATGYDYFLKNDVIIVKSAGGDITGELISRPITLKYLDPITAKKALDSRISDQGEVIIMDRQAGSDGSKGTYHANRIVITERPNRFDQLIELVAAMDIPERLVLIEAKIIETKVDDVSRLGFLWPSSATANITGADGGSGSSSTSTTTDNSDNNLGSYDPQDGSWQWGRLSVKQLSLVLDMLDKDGKSKLISDPRITTLENHEAVIAINTVIPIQTINRFSEGAVIQDIVTFQDEEVGVTLKVTPRINDDGQITLEVNPTIEDIIGYSGSTDNQKPITASRSITTRITVKNGETAALGGLFKEDEIKVEQRVPLLGHIPLLGKLLFTNRSTEKTTTDLIILITPTILP